MENKDFEIEIQDAQSDINTDVQLPLNFLSFGEIENDDVRIYIKQNVYNALEKLASSNTSKELGSIILGEYVEKNGKIYVIISEYIEAKYTDASASTLTFTHDTWGYIHTEHEKLYPNMKIVGWQHTHPNYGVFLSNYDMFIQENFFNMPFQVAYVIDPIQNIRGFFQWKNGKVEKLRGYYIYDEVGKPIKIEQAKTEKHEKIFYRENKAILPIISVFCAVCLLLGLSLIYLKKDLQQSLNDMSILIDEQKETIDKQSEEITNLQQYVTNEKIDTADDTTADTSIEDEGIESDKIWLENKNSVLDRLNGFLEKNDLENLVAFTVYTIQPGDSLLSICVDNEIDYRANCDIILAINGIENANEILAGQNILLPIIQKTE
ncbi:MAG: LysM peptidoglycan-binding domain-containing protein [Acutalibacteraceae bacterium]|nr:LysM peptidoglycan-binding domain-containing protein [Acutalibacteraceae bacterium]